LRTFAITASSGIPISCGPSALACRRASESSVGHRPQGISNLPSTGCAGFPGKADTADFHRWQSARPIRKEPAGNGLLDGGRNSLLESAQEATIISLSMRGDKVKQLTPLCRQIPPAEFHVSALKKSGLAPSLSLY
jgi:hypothetical protein